jgi:hypothetical protein
VARLEQSEDFRPFKLRIQAFTNAFQDMVNARLPEPVSVRAIKMFLWSSPLISRFNEDGKKAKSKGNHIWVIEAKKIAAAANQDGSGTHSWEFKRHEPRIISPPSKIAYIGDDVGWSWTPRVWHPQVSALRAVFTALAHPPWVGWKDGNALSGILCGTPPPGAQGGEMRLQAHYVHEDQLHRLEHAFFLQTAPLTSDGTVVQNLEVAQEAADAAAAQEAEAVSGGDVAMPQAPGEATQYSIVDPQQAPKVLSQIAYPYTPPIFANGPFFEQSTPAHQQVPLPPASEPRTGAMSDMQLASALPPHMQPQMQAQPSQALPLSPASQVQVQQVRAMLERQQEQASTIQLAMPPTRRPSGPQSAPPAPQQSAAQGLPYGGAAQSGHGTMTPMSSMPADMGATLPAFSPPPPGAHTAGVPPSAMPGSNDPMLSPALRMDDFDPLGTHGAQMQQLHDAVNGRQ